MLAPIMGMVKQNTEQIAALQGKLSGRNDAAETAAIEVALQEGKNKHEELIKQLEAAQAQLALSENQKKMLEQQKSMLEQVIAEQGVSIAERSSRFEEDELSAFASFKCVILFDTCSIENQLDLLDYIQPNEMVRISQTVIEELENHKKNGDFERKKAGQRALKAIKSRKCSDVYNYEHAYPQLLPKAFQIKEDDNIGTKNDKFILSAALRYKVYSELPVILISDDVTVQVMAMSEHINTMTAAEFIAGRTKRVDVIAPISEQDYLMQKLKEKDFSLTMNEIVVLHSYHIVTYGDFINASAESISFICDKRGINLGNRLLSVHKKIKNDFEKRF